MPPGNVDGVLDALRQGADVEEEDPKDGGQEREKHVYIYIYMYMCMCIEREREREMYMYVCVCIYIYISHRASHATGYLTLCCIP